MECRSHDPHASSLPLILSLTKCVSKAKEKNARNSCPFLENGKQIRTQIRPSAFPDR